MNLADLNEFVAAKWDEDLVPQLVDYVRVPAKSPAFDASWDAHGHLRSVVKDGGTMVPPAIDRRPDDRDRCDRR